MADPSEHNPGEPSRKDLGLQRVRVFANHVISPLSRSSPQINAIAVKSWSTEELLPQLTVAELVGLVSGRDLWHNHGVPRLNIPPLHVSDGPNGARGPNMSGEPAACAPCGIALGATWDVELCRNIGALLGEETRIKGAQILLAPTVNLHRAPITGRHFECFSEDPYLTACLGVTYIQGVQSVPGIGACVKHFVANDQEDARFTVSVDVSEQVLRQSYFVPFEAAVREAKVMSVMTGYNRLNGTHCSEHAWLLGDVLRRDWGFNGLVMSDWYGTHSTAPSLLSGLDLEMPFRPKMFYGNQLLKQVEDGKIPVESLRESAGRVLHVMEQLGLLDSERREEPPRPSPNTEAQRAMLNKAAMDSIVLLKNDSDLLPLPSKGSIAVLGARAQALTLTGGGSPQVHMNPTNKNLLRALQSRVSGTLRFELGSDSDVYLPHLGTDTLIAGCTCAAPSGQGLLDMLVFNGKGPPSGEPIGTIPIETLEGALFNGIQLVRNPVNNSREPWCARLVTNLQAHEAGRYQVGVATSGFARVTVRGRVLIEQDLSGASSRAGVAGALDLPIEKRADLYMEAGETVQLEIEWVPPLRKLGRLAIGCRWCSWKDHDDLLHRAELAAKAADAAIVVVGTNEYTEREGDDQISMDLVDQDIALIHCVAKANPRTVVCINSGSPKTMVPWVEEVGAVLAVWFGGQEAAEALASVLIDGASRWGPCGRLPTTWPRALADCPAGIPRGVQYPGENGRVVYAEGTFIGYRWFEAKSFEPLFPFGFGLSYTKFVYDSLELIPGTGAAVGQDVEVLVNVKNIGDRPGKEVVQVYVRRLQQDGPRRAVRELCAFSKLSLLPGESSVPRMKVKSSSLAPAEGSAQGAVEFLVGSSCRDIALKQQLRIG